MSITKKNKERISISIDPGVLDLLDRSIDGISVQSRSEAVEKIISAHVSEKKRCVILAGGKSTNLKLEKSYRPLAKIGGKPLIELIITKARKAGYENIIIIGSREVISEIYKVMGESGIEYIEEKKHLDTAKTLQLARSKIRSSFLFLPCDHYFEINLKEMELYHKNNKSVCTLAVYSGTEYEWKKSSIVKMEGNKIIEYSESPSYVETHLTSLLIGFAEPEIFDRIPSAEISYSLQKDVFPELARQGSLIGYLYSGKWKNIHSAKDVALMEKNNPAIK
jgi:NDP-sugar pyrophosphorylase family protein